MRTLVSAAALTAACSSPSGPPPARPAPPELAARYQACWDHVAASAWDALSACYAESIESVQQGLPPVHGRAAVVAVYRSLKAAFPDARLEPQLVIASGSDALSVRWLVGTHTGALTTPAGDIPATGKRVGLAVLHHMTFDASGRATRETFVMDVPTLMFQVGVSEGPARPASEAPTTGQVIVATGAASEQHNANAVTRAYALWNARDRAFEDILADDIVESNNSEAADSIGKAALQAHNAAFQAAFSDIRVDVERVVAAGSYTVGFERLRGTHDGDLGPIKRTGKPIDLPIVEIIEWRNGRAVRSWPFMNGMQLAMQLGLM